MKRGLNFITLSILFTSVMHAQPIKSSLPNISEQKEIKATNHLKKEIEMKQLKAQPEKIADSAAVLKTSEIIKNKRRKFSIKKTNI